MSPGGHQRLEAPAHVRLVACSNCHTQYDVTDVSADSFPCRCGETVENRNLEAVDARVHRCGSCGALVAPDAKDCEYCGSAIVQDHHKLSLICPECYARCAETSRFCTACGVGFNPEPIRADGHELPCPVCETLMPARQVGGIGLNECASCNGLWVPGVNFDALVNRAIDAMRNADPTRLPTFQPRVRGSNPARQKIQYRKCPECDAYMQRRNFQKSSGVIIDLCRHHGTWLDADELEQIAGFILSGGKTSELLKTDPVRTRSAPAADAFARILVERRGRGAAGSDEGGLANSLLDVLSGLLK